MTFNLRLRLFAFSPHRWVQLTSGAWPGYHCIERGAVRTRWREGGEHSAHRAKERNEEVLLFAGPSETATRYWPTIPLRPFCPCQAPIISASTCAGGVDVNH